MLREVIQAALTLDRPFVETRSGAPLPDDVDALRRLWSAPRFEQLSELVRPNLESWNLLLGDFERLERDGEAFGSYDEWVEFARAAEGMESPVAAAIAAMYPVAAWSGAVGGDVFSEAMGRPQPAWGTVALSLARSLARARASWSAGWLAKTALEIIQADRRYFADPELQELAAQYNRVAEEADRLQQAAVRELAWELCEACAPAEPTFAPEVAALAWTLGDPVRAQLILSGARPTPAGVERLVEQSLRRVEADPFAQYIWLEMKDRPPLDLRAHPDVFHRLNMVYTGTPLHLLDQSFDPPVSATYARALIAHFRGGMTEELASAVHEAAATSAEALLALHPHFGVRLRALASLTVYEGSADVGDRWRELCENAARAVEGTRNAGVYDPYDLSLDMPFAYLPADTDSELEDALDAIERYRAGAIAHWLSVTRPPPPDSAAAAKALEEETLLLEELRAGRFSRLLPKLPAHYRRFSYVLTDEDPPDPYDQDAALERLRDVHARLGELWGELAETVPDYGAARLRPVPGIEDFAALIAPPA